MANADNSHELAAMLRNRWWRAVGVAALLAVALTAVLGGFRKAGSATHPYPELGAGTRVDNGALAVTPLRAWVDATRPGGMPNDFDKQDYLVLRARVENRTDSGFANASYLQSDLFWLADGASDAKKADSLQRGDDHGFYVNLQPRLPVEIDLVWTLPRGQPLPPKLVWGLYARDFVEQTYLTREAAWVQGNPRAKLILAVEDRRRPAGAP
ncbi:hypothetical protein [Luteimonas aquatica]|uniref:hypothetical protein n=1 Tax=Luteimonas aquatica TaxID=450364 RepID=UPI001F59897D|nr:hypothetical protein [Luteimonas aquatica]